MNIFTNLFLATVILLPKSTCLREIFMFISQNSSFLRFTHIYTCFLHILLFNHDRQCYYLKHQSFLFLPIGCVFAILTIVVLNFLYLTSKQTALKVFHKNLEKF